jgi:hypothetical protein
LPLVRLYKTKKASEDTKIYDVAAADLFLLHFTLLTIH